MGTLLSVGGTKVKGTSRRERDDHYLSLNTIKLRPWLGSVNYPKLVQRHLFGFARVLQLS